MHDLCFTLSLLKSPGLAVVALNSPQVEIRAATDFVATRHHTR